MRSRRAVLVVGTVMLAAWIASCADTNPTNPADTTDSTDTTDTNPPSTELVVSDTSSLPAAASFGRRGVAAALADEAVGVAYVSVSSGWMPQGELAIIRNRRTDSTTTAVLRDGGIDPHPVVARAGDSLDVDIRVTGGALVKFRIAVPVSRPPRVVRAFPPRGKTGVPLNARMAVTFTEPMDVATLESSVSLRRGTEAVPGSWHLLHGGTEAVFEPAVQLAPSASYQLDVTGQVRDTDGEPLGEAVAVDFTTGTSVDDDAESVTLDVQTITSFGSGSMGLFSELRFMLRLTDATEFSDSGTPYPLFDDRAIRDGDDGDTIVATDATDPHFAGFAALATDGIDQLVTLSLATGLGSGGSTQHESSFFTGRPGPGPDLAGYTIERVEFVIDSVRIVSPGEDPNGDGNWTEADLSGRVRVIGRRTGGAAMRRTASPPAARRVP